MEKVIHRYRLGQEPHDATYWMTRPPAERLDAVEHLRLAWLETHPDAVQRLQRVYRVVKRQRG